ncbi:MAG TPA: hypothetical protein VGD48_25115 [Kutzneria sp.]|jgi:hypothetical protein
MMWLFGQVFVWCLVSFVAGSAVTAAAFLMQRRLMPPPVVVAEPAGETKGVKKVVEMEAAE